MDKTPAELAAAIHDLGDVDLEPTHRYVAKAVGADRTAVHHRGPSITAPSVELDNVQITVTPSLQEPRYLGTFDRTLDTRMVVVSILARGPAETSTGETRPVDIPVREQIAWVREALGDLADYAYRVVNDMAQFRVRPAFFVVLVDADATPRLAPSDFQWVLVCGGRRAYPEKLVPENRELRTRLRLHGDLINAELVPHPQASPPEVWAFEFVSQFTATIADRLGRMDANRPYTFDEITLEGRNRVIVRYTWHLIDEDRKIAFDIDLDGVRAERLDEFDDPRARTAAYAIAYLPFDQTQFPSSNVVDGVTWVRFGASD